MKGREGRGGEEGEGREGREGRGGKEGEGREGRGEEEGEGRGGKGRGGFFQCNVCFTLWDNLSNCGFLLKGISQIMFLLLSCTHLKVVVHGVGHPESSVVRRLHLYTVAVIAHACMHTQHVCTQHTHTHSTLQALEVSSLTSRMSEI